MLIPSDDPQQQAAKERRKRKIPLRGILFLVTAIVAALAAATLLTRYMDARVRAARVPTAKVVVADVDIPVATPIKAEWLKTVDWPEAARPEGAASDPAALVSQVSTVSIARGEPVLPSKLASGGAARSGLATLVPEGMRAVAVKVDDVVGVAGFIHPGDRVDVLVTMQPRQDSPFVSKIVLQHVKVLAVGKNLEYRGKDAREAVSVTVATLMVTSEESERLALATDKGHILLALRGLADEEFADTRGVTPPMLLLTAVPEPPKAEAEPEPKRVAAAPARARPRRDVVRAAASDAEPKDKKQTVEILRGDLFEKRSFDAQEMRP